MKPDRVQGPNLFDLKTEELPPAPPRSVAVEGLFPVERGDVRARSSDPETSKAALGGYNLEKLSGAMRLVYTLLETAELGGGEGLADFEIAYAFAAGFGRACHVSLHQQARNQLKKRGLVEDSGERRKNPTGMNQVVWRRVRRPGV